MGPRSPARDRLLDAVEVLLVERGMSGLTLDHVAEHAGVSKGGLLYHVPSKAKLLDGLIERLNEMVADAVKSAPSDPGGEVMIALGKAFGAGAGPPNARAPALRPQEPSSRTRRHGPKPPRPKERGVVVSR